MASLTVLEGLPNPKGLDLTEVVYLTAIAKDGGQLGVGMVFQNIQRSHASPFWKTIPTPNRPTPKANEPEMNNELHDFDIAGRHLDSWQSFRSLPVWVAGILVPVNGRCRGNPFAHVQVLDIWRPKGFRLHRDPESLTGIEYHDLNVSLPPVAYDLDAWLPQFDRLWPVGLPAVVSYRHRIISGTSLSPDHVVFPTNS